MEKCLSGVPASSCPFCGSSKVKVCFGDANVDLGLRPFVQCDGCGAMGPDAKSSVWAVRKWNKRKYGVET